MKIQMTRITDAETRECWVCGEPLWHKPMRRWESSIGSYVIDSYQLAFRMDAETTRWSRLICNTCSYCDAETLQVHFSYEIEYLTRQAKQLREIASESLISPSDDDRMREDSTLKGWNEP